ncbi:hypothetical protein DL98DRAFT_651045 [Cadophora sp. DSE1049]|nr:hypothetical protein DL98DRAFT_651045 [Cadophora sp. DSE1049]
MARVKGSGKSGGCRTCKRRRLKCDERKPTCERCEKARVLCEGYVPEHRFVDENARMERQVKEKTAKTVNTRSAYCISAPPKAIGVTHYFTEHMALKKSPKINSGLNLGAFFEGICTSFLVSHLLSGHVCVPWLEEHAQDISSISGQKSIHALGALYFGRIHHQDEIASRGHELYGQALVALNRDLQDDKMAWSISVIKSAMALELYELFAFRSHNGWMKHAGGVGRLIELRGPWRHQSVKDRFLLEGNRVTIALECLIQRKRCFLEDPDWKHIPWALDPDSKSSLHYLHDQLCDIPGLVEDTANLQIMPLDSDNRTYQYLILSQKISIQLRTIYEWRASWAQQNPDSWHEIPSSNPLHEQISPTVFRFKDLIIANEVTFYNALLLLLHRLGNQVIGHSFDASIPALDLPADIDYGPLYAPGLAPNIQAIGMEICRSVEYHLVEERVNAGAFFLLFPLTVAYQVYEPGSREATWLRGVMNKIADSSGFEIGRHIWGTSRATTSA